TPPCTTPSSTSSATTCPPSWPERVEDGARGVPESNNSVGLGNRAARRAEHAVCRPKTACSARPTRPTASIRLGSERLQVLDQVADVPIGQRQAEMPIVVVDGVLQALKPAVVVEASLRVGPEAPERHRPVSPG